MGPGLLLGARCWARVLPLLRPSSGLRWLGTRASPPQVHSRLGRGLSLASAAGARGLRSGARRDQADALAERAAAGHTGPKFDIDLLVSLLRQENAKDICVIQVSPELKYTDYFVVVSGTSPRHLEAMAQYIVKMHKFLKSKSDAFVRIEGKDADDWLCVDFGSIVIHLILPGTREIYELEKLWTLGTYDDQLAQIAPESLPEDFILGFPPEEEPLACSPLEAERE
ncbi:mitochondrial assembly of ribosomal large subunit protein 1 [Trichosurus vulpecula]|uniref:mitochondrial assembly of ribosomal large subunit protein 1 n=1 Tax=Trichosurus vulpecula TaxID=9337 RepID=UPI00186AEBEA|nr:mitochondrial assembly of ribosomal large subunit protein 1 [Trichosurus vulpecula]